MKKYIQNLIQKFQKPKDQAFQLRDLEEYLQFLNSKQIPKEKCSLHLILNEPVKLTYENDENYKVLVNQDLQDNPQTQEEILDAVDIYYNQIGCFYSSIQCQKNPQTQTDMFGARIFKQELNLKPSESIIIQQPVILISSINGFGFPTMFDQTFVNQRTVEKYQKR